MARRKSEAQKAAEKAVKKTHTATLVFALLFLIIGCIGGVVVSTQLTKNDKFELNGDAVVRLDIGEEYEERGVTVISFGRDISEKTERGGDVDSLIANAEEGIYQIVYTVDDFRWGEYQRVRTVIVGNPEGAEEFING